MKATRILMMLLLVVLVVSACSPAPTAAPATEEPQAAAVTEAPAAPAQATEAPAAEPTTAPKPTHDGIVRVGYTGKVKTLNPVYSSMSVETMHFRQFLELLYEFDLNAEVQPWLAKDMGKVSDDGLTWVIDITDQSTWSDGEPLTAEDVAFSMNLYKDREDGKRYSQLSFVESIEATGPYQVTFKLKEPRPHFAALLTDVLFILPKHIFEPMKDDPNLADFTQLDAPPVGSGPWTLQEIKVDEYAVFAPRKDHWKAAPKSNGLILQTFANNDASVQALIAGQVDLIERVPLAAIETVSNAENITVTSGMPTRPSVDQLIINQVDSKNCEAEYQATCGGHPALKDVNVRKAMAHATNQAKMIEMVYGGKASPGITLVPPSSIYFNKDLKPYEYNLDTANQILDDAGYKDTNGDGVRNMPDGGRELVFKLNFDPGPAYSRQAEILDESFKQIGIKLEIAPMEASALSPFVNPQYAHDLVIWGWGTGLDPDFMLSLTTTDMINNRSSEVGYSNPAFDELYTKQAVASSIEERQKIIAEMQEIFMEDLPYIVFFYKDVIFANRTDKFEGWTFTDTKGTVSAMDTIALTKITPVYK